MKKIIFIFSYVISSNLLVAQNPKNVVDYYQRLPNSQFSMLSRAFSEEKKMDDVRKKYITITDIKNGYLKVDYPGSVEDDQSYNFEVVLFKKKNGNYIIALSETHCLSACSGIVKFLEYTNGKWNDVTKKVFTIPSYKEIQKYFDAEDDSYIFTLPRIGKTMELFSISGNTLSEKSIKFNWDGEKFVRVNF